MKNMILSLLLLLCGDGLAETTVVTTLIPQLSAAGDGIVVSDKGEIYVAAGQSESVVWRLDDAGRAEPLASGLNQPVGIALDGRGGVYVGNFGSGEITRILPDGSVTKVADGFDGICALGFDHHGMLYVTEFRGSRICRVSSSGAREIFATGPLIAGPTGIAIDEHDNIYYANWEGGRIYRIRAGEREPEQFVELPGVTNINQIALLHGSIYVPAPLNQKIYRVSLTGDVEHIAGTGDHGQTDGPALTATFSRPNSIGSTRDGKKFYVVDNDTNAIRVIHMNGTTCR